MKNAVPEPMPLTDTAPPPPELATCDLSALAPEDSRHWVANAVVQSIAATDAGPRIDRTKLADLVERHYDDLVCGNQFDFRPVFSALCRVKGVSETTLYIGIVNLQQRLAHLNIEMVMPDVTIDQWTRAQLLREAHEATEKARLEYEQSRLRGAVQDLHRAKLGALLVQERLISETELGEALDLQKKNGGRLGSNLVQLGFVAEADLARFLGRQLGLPCVTEIDHITPQARRAVPQEILLKHRLVPLTIDAKEIQVAMVDPTDLVSIDEIGFVTDRRVRPVIAPELVVDFARARFFGIRQAPRLLVGQDAAAADGQPAWPRSAIDRRPVVLPAPDDEPYDLSELAHDLLSSELEDDLYPPLWRLWAERFNVVALLTVEEGMVRGRRLHGVPDAAARFAKAQTPVCSHPVLDEIVSRPRPYTGPCDHSTGSQWLSHHLGLVATATIFIVPLRDPADQVVALMLGYQPREAPPESEWLEAVSTAARATLSMVHARRVLRRVQTCGRPTVHRVPSVV